jgi:hypothetical protein
MGGFRQDLPFLDRLVGTQTTFLVTGWEVEKRSGHVLFFDWNRPAYLPDLIAASDLVVCKLGYSTMAEVWLQDRPLLYVANDRHRESRVLRRFVQAELDAAELSQGEFDCGKWLERVAGGAVPPADGHSARALKGNGAGAVAERVLAVLAGSHIQ